MNDEAMRNELSTIQMQMNKTTDEVSNVKLQLTIKTYS